MVTFVGASQSIAWTAPGTKTVALPAGTQPGDLLVMFAGASADTAGGYFSGITAPAGWALQGTEAYYNSSLWDIRAKCFTKTAASSEPDPSVTFAGGAGSADWYVQVLVYRGATVGPFAQAVQNAVSPVTAPAVTTTAVNSLVLRHWGLITETRGNYPVTPTGLTQRTQSQSGIRIAATSADVAQAAAGSSGTSAATVTPGDGPYAPSGSAAAFTLALTPDTAGIVVTGQSFAVTATALDGTVAPYPIKVAGESFRVTSVALEGAVSGAAMVVAGEPFRVTATALDGTAQTASPPVVVETSTQYANLGGYNYGGEGEVDYDPPVAPSPTRIKPTPIRRVHQSLPVPTLVNGRPV